MWFCLQGNKESINLKAQPPSAKRKKVAAKQVATAGEEQAAT
jgi:hypothetical protein